MRMLVDGFRKIVRYHRWIQRPGIIVALLLIVLAFLAMVQQRTGEVQKFALIVFNKTLLRLPEVY